ncbi:HD domain-containing phosphohydrolase [Roseibium algicola]|uniref:HD-GYP domain-containing protein n=1 Tax=Roseibium algicola TaxID=2857014 RepID=UPI0034589961
MVQILVAAVDFGNFPSRFARIATLYPTKRIAFSRANLRDIKPRSLLLVDFLDLGTDHIEILRDFSRSGQSVPALGIVDTKSRQSVLQARELGFYNLIDREEKFATLFEKIREVVGDYSKPTLPSRYSEKIVKSVETTSMGLNLMSAAALSGAPLPMQLLATNAQDITSTIMTEGLDSWLSAVQCHHSHTFCHTMMVAGHTVSFSRALGHSEAEQTILGLGALVHDLGKVKIPLSILDKPGRLTLEERELVNKHPLFSREMLATRQEVPKQVVEMALCHHEFLDGTGYPDGLKGNQISQRVRLLTISDIYSALTEKRAYKDSLSPRQAFAIMFEMKGKLDMDLLRKFRTQVLSSEFGRVRRQARA